MPPNSDDPFLRVPPSLCSPHWDEGPQYPSTDTLLSLSLPLVLGDLRDGGTCCLLCLSIQQSLENVDRGAVAAKTTLKRVITPSGTTVTSTWRYARVTLPVSLPRRQPNPFDFLVPCHPVHPP